MKLYRKAILPIGFKANGMASGIKKSGRLDLALFYSDIPAKSTCQFTANKIQAACIKINKRYLKNNGQFQAIIVNSGNANCFTGNFGLRDAEEITKSLAEVLGIKKEAILVSSTGIIGRRLPLSKIKDAIPDLVRSLSRQAIDKAKRAIMTTDTFTKEITVKFNIGNQIITMCGIAKGAGMIAPNMACPEQSRGSTSLTTILSKRSASKDRGATMLCFLLTDAHITQRALIHALKTAVDKSFNCITVDGCMSTNDSVIMLANGASNNTLIDINPVRNIAAKEGHSKISNGVNKNFDSFVKALNIVCLELAKLIVKDAEGATKFIQIKVKGAKSFQEAKKVALSIANSNLFKTAMYGKNPNFGRIVASVGASGIDIKERDLKIKVSPLNKRNINVDVSLNRGDSEAVVYTSDLTPEYIKINAEYN